MRQTYGFILTSAVTHVTRAVFQDNDRVVIQSLKVDQEVTLTLAELGALTALAEQDEQRDPVLQELARVEALTLRDQMGTVR